jgi:uncharacterized protein
MIFFKICLFLLIVYLLICLIAFLMQESLIFHPDKLARDFVFDFNTDFEEIFLELADGIQLHAVHFKAENAKGIVFYVHGNAGSMQDWGHLYDLYIDLGYDLLMFDYRGFGKSVGRIHSQQQFYDDVQAVYDYVKTIFDEKQIIVQSFSIGTAAAVKIATENDPDMLILKAPFYSLTHLIKSRYFFLPAAILKYKFMTADMLKKVKVPVTVFHGTTDELIPFSNAQKLKDEIPEIDFVTVPDCLHNDLPYTSVYKNKMKELLK